MPECRVFDRDEIIRGRTPLPHRDAFVAWMGDRYGMSLDKGCGRNGRSLYSYLRRYSFEGAYRVLGDLSKATSSDDDYNRKVRGSMPEEMKREGAIDGGCRRGGADDSHLMSPDRT